MTSLHALTDASNSLASALAYIGRSWRVLPVHWINNGRCSCCKVDCASPGKHPLVARGVKDATANESDVRLAWASCPHANIGIATGRESGIFVVDVDDIRVLEMWRQLMNLQIPPTPISFTGGGGVHLYFRYPTSFEIGNRQKVKGLPVDIRGTSGYVLAEPSNHILNHDYQWLVNSQNLPPAEIPFLLLAQLGLDGKDYGDNIAQQIKAKLDNDGPLDHPPTPDEVLQIIKGSLPSFSSNVLTVKSAGPDIASRAIAYINECPPAISGSAGHSQTFEVARAIVYGFDLGAEIGFDLLTTHYNPRCVPPWSSGELRHKCKEADSKPFDKPRGYLLNGDDNRVSISPIIVSNDSDIETLELPVPPSWPTLHSDARHGLAGEIVGAIEPESEADPTAILLQLVAAFGNAVGRGPHMIVDGARHGCNLYICAVGKTSKGRKGTSLSRVKQFMKVADSDWLANRVKSGLCSGEGLIHYVRDPVTTVDEAGKITVDDEGVSDKRLFVAESEFGQVLRLFRRESNTLPTTLRSAWDGGDLSSLQRNVSLHATDTHITIVGHVTQSELIKLMSDVEIFSGTGNRFLWMLVTRSKVLPHGGRMLDLSSHGVQLKSALAAGRNIGRMERNEAADRLWEQFYYQNAEVDLPGLAGAIVARGEAQALRLSMIYALLDGQSTITERHLAAAIAVWRYCSESAAIIFGNAAVDPFKQKVLDLLKSARQGLTRTDLHAATGRNRKAAEFLRVLADLRDEGKIFATKEPTAQPGRPSERWHIVTPTKETKETKKLDATGINSFNSFLSYPSPDTNSTNATTNGHTKETKEFNGNGISSLNSFNSYTPTPPKAEEMIEV